MITEAGVEVAITVVELVFMKGIQMVVVDHRLFLDTQNVKL